MEYQSKQDVGYYSPKVRTWVKLLCELQSKTSSRALSLTKGSDGILHRHYDRGTILQEDCLPSALQIVIKRHERSSEKSDCTMIVPYEY